MSKQFVINTPMYTFHKLCNAEKYNKMLQFSDKYYIHSGYPHYTADHIHPKKTDPSHPKSENENYV